MSTRTLAPLLPFLLSGMLAAAQVPSSSSIQPPASTQTTPDQHLLIPEETPLVVRIDQPLSAKHSRSGQPVSFTLSQNVTIEGAVAIPRGSILHGEVVLAHRAGALTGTPELILKLDSLDLGGKCYPVYSYQFAVKGISRTAPAVSKIEGGAVLGGLAGNVLGTAPYGTTTDAGKAARIAEGAGAGAGIGTAAALIAPHPRSSSPPKPN
jgi:hypothetical protein